ncbi:AAA family ATPase [Limnoraphis robusta Tam1]|uniref:McrB family protein n=1 Tax=Limnoraphis robusta TaxID=1118279 RepID=UPI002B1FDE7E|nr:AAA family ATPase [Limnoraphis robusta]MEA5497898.1 AAA family ATPase [Limnoraphis robusta BA-68 BA1]MEA5539921.1 AAA family ATPase [Limnoraphis robusta Tam1]
MSEKQEEYLFTKEIFENLPNFIDKHPEINDSWCYNRKVFSELSRIKHFGKIASTLQNIIEIAAVFLDKNFQKFPNFRVRKFTSELHIKNDHIIQWGILISKLNTKESDINCDFFIELTPKSLQIKAKIVNLDNPGRIGDLKNLKNDIEFNDWRPHGEGMIKYFFIKELNSLEIYDDIDPEAYHSEIEIGIEEACRMSVDEFIYYLDKTFQKMLPLMLIYMTDDPIPGICKYLNLEPLYSLSQCADSTGFEEEELGRWVKIINRKKQVIFQGPPGTGKTFIAKQIAKHLIGGNDGFSELVQFHPAYTYEDFLQGIRPQTQDGQLTYSMVPGRFLEFCKKAESCKGTCILIIDEINRANLSQVFGELMYLLEYRREKICLAGSNEPFGIPSNVYIIGTMNTADRSIALVDHALRRRFSFITLSPNYDVLRNYLLLDSIYIEKLIDILTDLNKTIDDPHHELGISFFLVDDLENNIEDIWTMEIEPYLEEYFYDQPEKIKNFRWSEIKNKLFN